MDQVLLLEVLLLRFSLLLVQRSLRWVLKRFSLLPGALLLRQLEVRLLRFSVLL